MENVAMNTIAAQEMAAFGGPELAMPVQETETAVAPLEQQSAMEQQYQGFQVTDIKAADWACRKIVRYMELKKQVDDYVKEEMARLKDYQARMDEEYDDHINFLTEKLRPFAEAQIEGTKKKSFRLPSGNLQFRTGYDYDKDEARLKAYLKAEYPEYVKIEEKVSWGDFKNKLKWGEDGKAVTPDGEVLDFISRTEKKSFKVEI